MNKSCQNQKSLLWALGLDGTDIVIQYHLPMSRQPRTAGTIPQIKPLWFEVVKGTVLKTRHIVMKRNTLGKVLMM
jgi:uncharacterized protein YihD (DUF1040 family)